MSSRTQQRDWQRQRRREYIQKKPPTSSCVSVCNHSEKSQSKRMFFFGTFHIEFFTRAAAAATATTTETMLIHIDIVRWNVALTAIETKNPILSVDLWTYTKYTPYTSIRNDLNFLCFWFLLSRRVPNRGREEKIAEKVATYTPNKNEQTSVITHWRNKNALR